MKFLLSEELAREVEERLASRLSLDPHADPSRGNGYHIRTLYCDTPQLDVFHRVGRYRLFKFRLRQYGVSPKVFLERKSKRGHLVRKRRSTIPLEQIGCFADGPPTSGWEGDWYYRQLARNRFAPVCLIGYDRVAYYGTCSEGPLRLTFDRQIHGGLTSDWSLTPLETSQPLLTGLVVCEFKFRGALPSVFKSVIESLQLSPCGVSKYRHCIQSSGHMEARSVSEGQVCHSLANASGFPLTRHERKG